MIIVALSNINNITPLTNYSPFTYFTQAGVRSTANYWTSIFGATGENVVNRIFIAQIIEKPATNYSSVPTIQACEATERSFHWDDSNQVLYVHFSHNSIPDASSIAAGISEGYSDEDMIYVDEIGYDPVLKSVPAIQQKADLTKYDKLTFVSGSISFDNTGGYFDNKINTPYFGNSVEVYHLDKSKGDEFGNFTRSDLEAIASFYVENYSFSKAKFEIKVQDKRKAFNSNILTKKTALNQWVPIVYGQIRHLKALVDEFEGTTGIVTYRVAETMTNIGTVQVKVNDKWVTRTTNTVDLSNGQFTLTAANGRQGGANDGAPLPCRLVNSIGITPNTSFDVIKELNKRVLDVDYTDAFYNTSECQVESSLLGNVGVSFDKQMELFEAIRQVQAGSKVGFRYEIMPSGLRTIRVDDWSRALAYKIDYIDIKDSNSLQVNTDSATFATSITVKYARDTNENTYLTYTESSYEPESYNKYRQNPNVEIETVITDQSDAIYRAGWSAFRQSEIRGVLSVELFGSQYYGVRIYDIIDIDLGDENREYYGRWKAQVLSIAPDFGKISNKITAVLIERI